MRTLRLSALAVLLAAAPVAAQTPAATPAAPSTAVPAPAPLVKLDYDSLAFGRQVTNWFYAGMVDSLWAHTSPEWQAGMGGTKERWSGMFGDFLERLGSELDVVEEKFMKRNGQRQYVRVLHAAEFTAEPVAIRWVLLPGKMLGGAGMNPVSRMPPADPN